MSGPGRALVVVALTAIVAEGAVRAALAVPRVREGLGLRGHTALKLATEAGAFEPTGYIRYDQAAGWVPVPGAHPLDPHIEHVDADGMRVTRCATPPADAPRALAVGDSFTWGTDVADADAWPAAAEPAGCGAAFRNAAVPGYGPGQALRRMEQVLGHHPVQAVVFGWADADLPRTRMDTTWGYKPAFDAIDGRFTQTASLPDTWEAAHAQRVRVPRLVYLPRILAEQIADPQAADHAAAVAALREARRVAVAAGVPFLLLEIARPDLPSAVWAEVCADRDTWCVSPRDALAAASPPRGHSHFSAEELAVVGDVVADALAARFGALWDQRGR